MRSWVTARPAFFEKDERSKVSRWVRNNRGQLVLSDSKKDLIRSSIESSRLTISQFCAATGLKRPTISRIMRVTKKMPKKNLKEENLFAEVKIVPVNEDGMWEVCGPQGLQVKCRNLWQLAQLWRALC